MQSVSLELSALALGALAFLAMVLYAQRKVDQFDIRWILVDSATEKVSLMKLGQFVALSVSTWGFVVLIQRDKMTEYYFAGYLLAWTGVNLANKWITGKKDSQ